MGIKETADDKVHKEETRSAKVPLKETFEQSAEEGGHCSCAQNWTWGQFTRSSTTGGCQGDTNTATFCAAASVLSPAMRSDTMPDRPDPSWGDQKTLPRRPGPGAVLFFAAARTPRVKSSTRNVECQLLPGSLLRSHSAHSVCRTTKDQGAKSRRHE